MDDPTLRERYQQLREQHRADEGRAPVPLETIEALAEDRLDEAERLVALDQILADPAASAEYQFLRELAMSRPLPASRGRKWLIAAAVLVTVAGGLVWRASSPGAEPLRGADPLVLLGPEEGATLRPGGRFVWRPVVGAVGYVVEVLTPDGTLAFRAESADTTADFSAAQAEATAPGPAVWTVTARLGGTVEKRSTPRRIVLGR